MKKNKIYENLVWIIFLVIGIMFLVVSAFIYEFSIIQKSDRVEGIATIIDIYEDDENFNVLIMYEVDNIIYEKILNSYSSSYYVGKDITIYYDRNDPSRISDNASLELIYVFGGIGSFFLGVVLIILYFKRRQEKMIIRLKETGYVVNSKYLSTQINKHYTVNNRHPYNVICEWSNSIDGKKYIFKSKNIWVAPEKIINDKNIKTFKVYYNPNNLKQYYMDVDILFDNDNYFK